MAPSDRELNELRERIRKLHQLATKSETELSELRDAFDASMNHLTERITDLERRLWAVDRKLLVTPQAVESYAMIAKAFVIVFLGIVAGVMPFVLLWMNFVAARDKLTLTLEPLLITTLLGLITAAGIYAFGKKPSNATENLIESVTDGVAARIVEITGTHKPLEEHKHDET